VVEAADFQAEGLVLAATRTVPVVTHLHTPLAVLRRYGAVDARPSDAIATTLERAAVRLSSSVSSPSQLLIDELQTSGWLRRNDVRLIRNPTEPFRPSDAIPISASDPLVLFVGKLDERKAPHTVLEAVRLIANEGSSVEVAFVGRSAGQHEGVPYATWLERRAADWNIRCSVVEEVPRDELDSWYARCRVVVVPSQFDNFPMVALEAIAAGRPVICSTRTGTAELFKDGLKRFVVDPDDPPSLAAHLRILLGDANEARAALMEMTAAVRAACNPAYIAGQKEEQYRDAIVRFRRSGSVAKR
jgi:glycosyltransferase involved in cell wall biosynthesis